MGVYSLAFRETDTGYPWTFGLLEKWVFHAFFAAVFVGMKIWNQRGNTFQVGMANPTGLPAVDWEGRGVIEGDRGHYDWIFGDGKVGRTTFTVDKNGHIHGQVRGSGIDWDYFGRRADDAAVPQKK